MTATLTGSYEAAARVADKWGSPADDTTIHAHAQRAGARAEALAAARVERALEPATRAEVVAQAKARTKAEAFSLVIEMDGWMVRERGGQWGLKPPDQQGERVAWHEMKTAIVFRLGQRARTQSGRPVILEKTYVAWRGEPDEFGRRLYAEALRRGLCQAQKVYVVADGGVWIWNIVADRFGEATGVLDFYHASQHLWAVARALHADEEQARRWVRPLLHQLILRCDQRDTNNPVESRQAADAFGIALQRRKRRRQGIFHALHIAENQVAKPFLTDLLPQMFHRIALRTVWRQPLQAHIGGHNQIPRLVPAGLIHEHDNEIIGMPRGNLRQKQPHRLGVDLRQDQRIQHAVVGTDGRIGISELTHQLGRHLGSHAGGRPTGAWIIDAAEASFVLEYQPHRPTYPTLARDFLGEDGAQFFLKASAWAGSLRGWRRRGAILRQPWRASIR